MGKSGQRCAVWGCGNVQKPGSNISFHAFPLDEDLCKEWVEALDQPGFVVRSKSMVCCRHFAESDWSTTCTKKPRLKAGSLPCRYLAPPNCPVRAAMVQKTEIQQVSFLRQGSNGPLVLTQCGSTGQQRRFVPEVPALATEQVIELQVLHQQPDDANRQQSFSQQLPIQTVPTQEVPKAQGSAGTPKKFTPMYTFRVVPQEPAAPATAVRSMPQIDLDDPTYHPQQETRVERRPTGGGKMPGWQMRLRSERSAAKSSSTAAVTSPPGKGKKATPNKSSRAGGKRRYK